jgi:hypothetical protein
MRIGQREFTVIANETLDAIRECRIPEHKQIVISTAIGWPDWDFPANHLETSPEAVDTLTAWYGFD